ncbi:MAG: serine hydrolase domain-containing protein, partial [Luminiphilus sp.]
MTVDAETAGFDPAKLSRLERHFNERYLMPGKIPGYRLRVVRRGITAHDSALGLMDLERKKPMREDTIFRIYSMTKPITSIALMMLWEEGLFQLTDPVSKFIPSWSSHGVWNEAAASVATTRPPEQPMTVQHLLTHTAGLTYGGILPGMEQPVDAAYRAAGIVRSANEPLATFVNRLADVPLLYDPGSRWSYSVATDVCGY